MPGALPAPFVPLDLSFAEDRPAAPRARIPRAAASHDIADRVIDESLAHQARQVLGSLTPREERTLRMRFGITDSSSSSSSDEVGQDFEVTRQRIREIEARALRKLRTGRDSDD